MDKIVKKRWLKALRSGSYVQHMCELQSVSNPLHCCVLGVLADVVLREKLPFTRGWVWNGKGELINKEQNLNWSAHLPPEWNKAIFGAYVLPRVVHKGDVRHIMGLNDDGMPFDELADIIEKRW